MPEFRSDVFTALLVDDALAAWSDLQAACKADGVAVFCVVLTHFESPQSLYLAGCSRRTFASRCERLLRAKSQISTEWAALDALHGPADWPESPARESKASEYLVACGEELHTREPIATLCERALRSLDAAETFGSLSTREVTLAVVAPNDDEAFGFGSILRLNPPSLSRRFAMPSGGNV
jgi:hypothetical protein